MARSWSRRRLLSSVGAGTAIGTVGCLHGDDDPGTPTTPTPGDSVPSPTPVDDPDHDLSVDHPPLEEWAGYEPDWEPPTTSPLEADVEVETIVENLRVPWDLSFTGTGEVFITERPGQISRYDTDDLEVITEPADVIDHTTAIDVDEEGGWYAGGSEGGLLGCAVHPNYPDVPILYAFYTYEDDGDTRNRLVYYDVSGSDIEERILIDDIPGHENAHNGARLAFGPRNYLWVTMGDAQPNVDAYEPDWSNLAGTVFRIAPTGEVPPDTPDLPGADPRIYTYGHRNPQGIDWLPDGTPIITEHGPFLRDEVSLLRPGGNYGWPEVRGHPGDDEYGAYADHDGVEPPLFNTGTDRGWAPSGAVFYRGDAVPAWRNRFLAGGLASQQVNVLTPYPRGEVPSSIDDGIVFDADWSDPTYDATAHATLADELGRIRHVEEGPDGALYAITSNRDGRASDPFPVEGDDRLVRITAA